MLKSYIHAYIMETSFSITICESACTLSRRALGACNTGAAATGDYVGGEEVAVLVMYHLKMPVFVGSVVSM